MLRYRAIIFGVLISGGLAAPLSAAPDDSPTAEAEALVIPHENLRAIEPDLIQSDPGEDIEPDDEAIGDDDNSPPPIVEYDPEKLPPPVRRLREQIISAAETGEIERLRPIIDAHDEPPAIGLSSSENPIDHLKSLAGDPEGREILAILIEVLDAGYIHVDAGTPDELYLWPYFARYPLERLTGPQMVELFKLLTAGDYEDMKIYGTYLFYRVGIAPNGEWKFFVAGD